MEISTERWVNNCKIQGTLKAFAEQWLPEIIDSLINDKTRTKAIQQLKDMQKIISEELIFAVYDNCKK